MKIAVLQMTAGIDPVDNARVLVDAVAEAKANGAAMLFTPEMSGLIDRDRARAAGSIRYEREDVVLRAVSQAAAEHGLWLHLGSLAVRGRRGKYRNRAYVLDNNGRVIGQYDKLHMFDVDLPSGESWRESAAYAPGDAAVLVDTPIGRLGLSTCYDVRFAELYRELTDAGAEVLAVPAAFTRPTGLAHWHILLRARAIESAAYVVAAAQTGEHADGRATFGHSLVVDPWGEVLLDMGEAAGLGYATIDPARIAEVRSRIPVIAHRREIPPVTIVA